jgi:hypothetical protein
VNNIAKLRCRSDSLRHRDQHDSPSDGASFCFVVKRKSLGERPGDSSEIRDPSPAYLSLSGGTRSILLEPSREDFDDRTLQTFALRPCVRPCPVPGACRPTIRAAFTRSSTNDRSQFVDFWLNNNGRVRSKSAAVGRGVRCGLCSTRPLVWNSGSGKKEYRVYCASPTPGRSWQREVVPLWESSRGLGSVSRRGLHL